MTRSTKSRIKPVDISIVSSYMSRFQTAIVAALVLAITVHAYVTRGSDLKHTDLTIGVTSPRPFHGPLFELVASATGRRVSAVEADDAVDCELHVLPLADFMRLRRPRGLRALYGIGARANDRAVVVAAGPVPVDPSAIQIADVQFGSPDSPNACWAQLVALSRAGVEVPAHIDSLRFQHSGAAGNRIIFAVANGSRRFGACRASDLSRLRDARELSADDVTVVLDAPALPEHVIATTDAHWGYFSRRLSGLGAQIDGAEPSHDTVELLRRLGAGSCRPLSRTQLEEIDSVYAFVSARAENAAAAGD